MKEDFEMLFIEPFEDGGWNIVLGVITWMISIFLILIIVGFSLWLVDSSFLNEKQSKGLIVEKSYVADHDETHFVTCGKTQIPITQHISTKFYLHINIKGLNDKIDVPYFIWKDLNTKQEISCLYTEGRLFNTIYIKNIHN